MAGETREERGKEGGNRGEGEKGRGGEEKTFFSEVSRNGERAEGLRAGPGRTHLPPNFPGIYL